MPTLPKWTASSTAPSCCLRLKLLANEHPRPRLHSQLSDLGLRGRNPAAAAAVDDSSFYQAPAPVAAIGTDARGVRAAATAGVRRDYYWMSGYPAANPASSGHAVPVMNIGSSESYS